MSGSIDRAHRVHLMSVTLLVNELDSHYFAFAAEFSRESLSEAAVDGSECPFSKEEDDDCSRVASSDPSSQLNEAQAGK